MSLFPSIEHKLYKITFLLNTFTKLSFSERNDENCGGDVKKRITGFLEDCYGMQNHSYPQVPISLSRKDEGVQFVYTKDSAMVRINRNAYHSFGATLLPEASKLRRFVFDVLGLDRVNRVDVRKISVFPMKISSEGFDISNLREYMGSILSEKVLSLTTIDEVESVQGAVAPFTLHQMEDHENGFRYDILIGMVRDPKMENIYNVVLDSVCFCNPEGGIVVNELERKQLEMNQCLYNLFHWAVQDHVIAVMEKGVNNGEAETEGE